MAVDTWYLHASQGTTGRGAKPAGFEHHVVTKHGRAVHVRSEVSFQGFGHQHYEVDAKGCVRSPESTYRDPHRQLTIRCSLDGATWSGEVHHESGGDRFAFTVNVPGGLEAMPAMVARWLPVWLPREEGELFRYFPVSEDGYPQWRPGGTESFFSVLGAPPAPRTIVGRGEEMLPMASAPAFRYDHVEAGGEVMATTWVDRRGRPVAYEQPGSVLLITREADARAVLRRVLS